MSYAFGDTGMKEACMKPPAEDGGAEKHRWLRGTSGPNETELKGRRRETGQPSGRFSGGSIYRTELPVVERIKRTSTLQCTAVLNNWTW